MAKGPSPAAMSKFAQKFYGDVGAKIITASKVKELIKGMGLRMDGDLPDELAKEVVKMIVRAGARTVDNKRTTVKPCDL